MLGLKFKFSSYKNTIKIKEADDYKMYFCFKIKRSIVYEF